MEFASQSEKNNELMLAQAHIYNHIYGYVSCMSLKCAVQLGIPDIIHNHGQAPIPLSSLVDNLSIPSTKSDCVRRLMRFLVHSGFFATQKIDETEEEGYLLTPSSKLLLKDDNTRFTLSPFVLTVGAPLLTSFLSLSSSLKESGSLTPFEASNGVAFWDFLERDSELNKNFCSMMLNDSRLLMGVVVDEGKKVFQNLKTLIDLGGGTGAASQAIVEAFPHLQCTFTLHNWTDEECVKLLKKCKEAIPSREHGGKVIIIDAVVEEHQNKQGKDQSITTETQLVFDMVMMNLFGGKERTEKEWEKIFLESGFMDYEITPMVLDSPKALSKVVVLLLSPSIW
ncbi:hypothetical protein MKW94_020545 [Papaver nudicaule]|uniref:Uncharacterized protein n=1 Tax=Papaver nudicaule TaxID=74823 RepID=A0AA41SJ81_PAPNU|nr:hypothetical protein [Papaver nudicaule]